MRMQQVNVHTETVPLVDNSHFNRDFPIMTRDNSTALPCGASLRQVQQVQRGRETAIAATQDEYPEGSRSGG